MQKKRKIVAKSVLAQAIRPHIDQRWQEMVTTLPQDCMRPSIIKTIKEYCGGPYFFAHYVNNDHEQAGEKISLARIDPYESYIGTAGAHPTLEAYSTMIHRTDNGAQIRAKKLELQGLDMAWSPTADKMLISFGMQDSQSHHLKIVRHKPFSPAYSFNARQQGEYEYFCLRMHIMDHGYHTARVIYKDQRFFDLNPGAIMEEKGSELLKASCTSFLQDHDHIAAFAPNHKVTILNMANNSIEKDFDAISAVDFSCPNKILGTTCGKVQVLNLDGMEVFATIRAFKGIPIERIASNDQAIAAEAQGTIRIFDRINGQNIASIKHHRDEDITHIALSSQSDMIAYTVANTLYVKDCKNNELQRHVFKDPISWLHYGHSDNGLYVAEGGTVRKLRKDPTLVK